MKKLMSALLVLMMIVVTGTALAAPSAIDTDALTAYASYWNKNIDDPSLMWLEAAVQDGDIMFTALHEGEGKAVSPIELLLASKEAVTYGVAYTAEDDCISLVLPESVLSETPTKMRFYVDDASFAAVIDQPDDDQPSYWISFPADRVTQLLNGTDVYFQLTTTEHSYIEDFNTEVTPLAYLMLWMVDDARLYSNTTLPSYLDRSLLPSDAAEEPDEEEPSLTVPAEPHTAFQTDYTAIDQAAKSVFLLEVYDRDDNLLATGSGFVALDDSILITNEHVVEGNGGAYIIAHSDHYEHSYRLDTLLAVDANLDIAILQFPEDTAVPLAVDYETKLLRGQPVTAIGSPKGVLNTVSSGNISNMLDFDDGSTLIQFTAPISPGSSGGALFSESGKVIGLCVSMHKEGEAMYYAIPIEEVYKLYTNAEPDDMQSMKEYNSVGSGGGSGGVNSIGSLFK